LGVLYILEGKPAKSIRGLIGIKRAFQVIPNVLALFREILLLRRAKGI
jgi:hypothetical protein